LGSAGCNRLTDYLDRETNANLGVLLVTLCLDTLIM
jgi:hypothetical protein